MLHLLHSEDGSSKVLRNDGILPQHYTTLHARRPQLDLKTLMDVFSWHTAWTPCSRMDGTPVVHLGSLSSFPGKSWPRLVPVLPSTSSPVPHSQRYPAIRHCITYAVDKASYLYNSHSPWHRNILTIVNNTITTVRTSEAEHHCRDLIYDPEIFLPINT
jgi:hypothetical protein